MRANRKHVEAIFNQAIRSVHPLTLLPNVVTVHDHILTIQNRSIDLNKVANIYVIGAGKAAAAMALAMEHILGSRISNGVIATKYQYGLPLNKIELIETAHPIPDKNGQLAVSKTIALLNQAKPNDLVICLLSGGASALWADTPKGLGLNDIQVATQLLLHSGATIQEINTIRKHLSLLKGGQLLSFSQAPVYTLIISDVIGDALDSIASGPTVADPTTFADALAIVKKYQLQQQIPQSILKYLQSGQKGRIQETIKPGDPLLENSTLSLIGNNQLALRRAQQMATALGYTPLLIQESIKASVQEEVNTFFKRIKNLNYNKPLCILQGGESTVAVQGNGIGGRNQHFALCLLEKMTAFNKPFTILCGGTDGSDGPTDATGAIIDQFSLTKAFNKELNIAEYINHFDSYSFFKTLDDLVIIGPTQTNVMDLVIGLFE